MRRWFCAGLMLFPLTYATASAPAALPTEATELLTIAAEDNWPPFSDEHGKGLSYLLVNAALKSQGYQIRTEVVPYARALYLTEQGKTDALWNVTRQKNTEQDFLLHQVPLFQARSSFYFHRHAGWFKSVADIPDRAIVGVILGYEYGDLFEQHKHRFRLVEVSTHQQLIAMLSQDKLDLAIFFDDVLAYYLQKMSGKKPRLAKGHPNYVSDIYVAFDKRDPKSSSRAAALDAGLRQLQQSGDYQRMLQHYLQVNPSRYPQIGHQIMSENTQQAK